MNLNYFSKQRLLFAICAVATMATSCVREDLDACLNHRLTLKVVNAAGDEITGSGTVLHTTLYVFDKNLNFLESRKMDAAAIKNKQDIQLDYRKSEELTLVAWGNMSDKSETVSEAKRIEDLKVILKSNDGLAVQADSLYFGRQTVKSENGVLAADQQIVLAPQTGSVKIATIGLAYALKANGLKADKGNVCEYGLGETLDTYTHKGEMEGGNVRYKPEGAFVGTEYNTKKYNTYTGEQITLSLKANGRMLVEGVTKDDEGKPLSVEKGLVKQITLLFDTQGALVSVKTVVRDWGYADQEIIL